MDKNKDCTPKIEAAHEAEKKRIDALHNFYTVKLNNRGDVQIEFDNLRIINKLRDMGFFRYDMPNGAFQYVQLVDNKISIVSDTQIKDAFETYIRRLPETDKTVTDKDGFTSNVHITSWQLLEKLYKNINYYFSSTLDRLRPLDKDGNPTEIKLLSDTKNKKYLFYRNCAVVIENKLVPGEDGKMHHVCKHECIPYSEIKDGAIWDHSIIDRDFEYTDDFGDFGLFCECICGGHNQQSRLLSLQTILGYLMHDNYDCDLRAALLTDVNKDGSNDAGRTGKGILAKALSLVLNRDTNSGCKMINVPGKGFVATDPKRYSAGDISTQLIHIEDLHKKFDIEDLYGDITDKATFQKHYQNPAYRNVKIMLSMNQALRLDGSSKRGRVVIFELANFFSDKLRPAAYFGALHNVRERRFFEGDWDAKEWNKFDSFMVHCCELYLYYGIREPEDINFALRALKESIGGDDIYKWFMEMFGSVNVGERKMFKKKSLFVDFEKRYPGYIKTQRQFTERAQIFLKGMNIRSVTWRDGEDWFILYPNDTDDVGKKIDWIVK